MMARTSCTRCEAGSRGRRLPTSRSDAGAVPPAWAGDHNTAWPRSPKKIFSAPSGRRPLQTGPRQVFVGPPPRATVVARRTRWPRIQTRPPGPRSSRPRRRGGPALVRRRGDPLKSLISRDRSGAQNHPGVGGGGRRRAGWPCGQRLCCVDGVLPAAVPLPPAICRSTPAVKWKSELNMGAIHLPLHTASPGRSPLARASGGPVAAAADAAFPSGSGL